MMTAHAESARWMVVIRYDDITKATLFDEEEEGDARAFFDEASDQWSESYLVKIVIGPGPGFADERQKCRSAAYARMAEKKP